MTAKTPDAGNTLWHGRFAGGPSDELMAYTVSLPFDRLLWREDIACSRAHVKGLAHVGILSVDECDSVLAALSAVESEMSSGAFAFVPSDEDIHTAIERRVTELSGAAGAKLHTGRSRNDQSVTGFRLWCKSQIPMVARRVIALQEALLRRADESASKGAYLPGYTHVQRAQPVMLAHHLMAHCWALGRDVDRLLDALERVDVSPLGAGALAGSSLPLDPEWTARELGFTAVFDNSLDVVSDRDFAAEFLFSLSMIAVHLSRIGEEWVLWTSEEFGFATLDDAYATGSSMLPQKKNADIAELARGKAGRVIGGLTGLLATLKGLPLSYNRDLQEDKEPLFDAVEQVSLGLAAIEGMIATATFRYDSMQQAADAPTMAATDLAEFLVRSGVPFRDAHAVVGALVRRSLAGDGALVDLVASEPSLGPEAARLIEAGVGVTMRTTRGGAGPGVVKDQRERLEHRLAAWRAAVEQASR
ncbi:MAG: argininosuccinate lyase [Ilumatobacteraceae bacterium]